jgi:N utilization substance protein A
MIDKYKLGERIRSLSEESNLTADEVCEVIENSIIIAWESVYGEGYNLKCKVSNNSIELSRLVKVVEDISDIKTEITPGGLHQLGEIVEESLNFNVLPSRSIHVAEKYVGQKINELKKKKEYQMFSEKIGEVVTATVKQVSDKVVVRIGQYYLGMIPSYDRISTEHFSVGQRIKVRINKVEYNPRDLQIFVERNSRDFLEAILREEIPEMNMIKIEAIERYAGYISKVLLHGTDNVVGICLGPKGERLKRIRDILCGEKVDFIKYEDNTVQLVKNCFHNIKIEQIILHPNKVDIVVPDDKFFLAIGTHGRNVLTISKLLDLKINIIKHSIIEESKKLERNKRINKLIEYGLNEIIATFVVNQFNNLEDSLKSDFVQQDLSEEEITKNKNIIKKFLKDEREEYKNEFIEKGGDEELFNLNISVPLQSYFDLLKSDIRSINHLLDFKNPIELHQYTGISIENAITLIGSAKKLK